MHEQQKAGAKENTDSRGSDEPNQNEVQQAADRKRPQTSWGRDSAPGLAAMIGPYALRFQYLREDRGAEAHVASQARALRCPVAVAHRATGRQTFHHASLPHSYRIR
jgi:hypothetical protein